MKLKPRTTTLNPRAMLYKRFTNIEGSMTGRTVYQTTDGKKWVFDGVTETFTELTADITTAQTVVAVNSTNIVQYIARNFKYTTSKGWYEVDTVADEDLLSAQYGNIGKYQVNNYYYAGSFDYVIRGSIEGTTVQYLKGNIMPLTALNIKFFNDDIKMFVDDLVVLEGHLYVVESVELNEKHQPKKYSVYSATLNSIL